MVTELKTTTSAAALATVTPSKVTPIVAPPSHADAMAQAKQAFTDDANHEKLAGSGVQRMMFAVMVECVRGLADGTLPFRLADAFTPGNERKTIQARLSLMFAGDKPDVKAIAAAKGSEAATEADKLWSKRNGLVSRGVEGAAILATHGVPFTAFDHSKGIWSVFPNMLHPKNATPIGRLTTEAAIALDGRPVVWTGQAANGKALSGGAIASYAHMLSVCKAPVIPRAARPGAGLTPAASGSTITFDPKKATDVAREVSAVTLMAALWTVFVKEAPAGLPRRADYPLEFWTQKAAFMQKCDEAEHDADWLTPRDSESKAEIAARKTAAKSANQRKSA